MSDGVTEFYMGKYEQAVEELELKILEIGRLRMQLSIAEEVLGYDFELNQTYRERAGLNEH